MTPTRAHWLLLSGIIIIIIVLFFSVQSKNVITQSAIQPSIDGPNGKLFLTIDIPNESHDMTLYQVTPQENDMIDYYNRDPVRKGNVSSEAETPAIAKKILDKYGGLPHDIGKIRVTTQSDWECVPNNIPFLDCQPQPTHPELTRIFYERSLDGLNVEGGGYIKIEIGQNEELLSLRKIWRTVTPSGTIRVISATEALKKIQRGEVYGPRLKCICDLNVNDVHLAYMENGYNESQEYLTPVWVFAGTLSSGGPYSYQVSAFDGDIYDTPQGFSTPRTGLASTSRQ